MAKTPKSSRPHSTAKPAAKPAAAKPRVSRGKSGKPPPPPPETAAGTPMPRGFSDMAQADFDVGGAGDKGHDGVSRGNESTLPALRQSGPRPLASAASTTAYLEALLAKPQERSETARQILAQQPLMATHPIVAGSAAEFTPHRPARPSAPRDGADAGGPAQDLGGGGRAVRHGPVGRA